MTIYVLPFEKMHGLGNDFIMIERRHLPNNVDDIKLAKIICDRHFGIGADGMIIVDFPNTKEADFKWDYYNSDGSEAQMCGNGMRCFAKYVFEKGFTDQISFSVMTKAGIITPKINDDGTVTVDMGKPFIPNRLKEELTVDSKKLTYTYIETGNPHCVIFLDYVIRDDEFYSLGPKIEKHTKFPERINVEFAQVITRNKINVRVWERGCGETLACGTGACAVHIAANINNLCDDTTSVILPGGELKIFWDNKSKHAYLSGPANFLFAGQFNLDPKLICTNNKEK